MSLVDSIAYGIGQMAANVATTLYEFGTNLVSATTTKASDENQSDAPEESSITEEQKKSPSPWEIVGIISQIVPGFEEPITLLIQYASEQIENLNASRQKLQDLAEASKIKDLGDIYTLTPRRDITEEQPPQIVCSDFANMMDNYLSSQKDPKLLESFVLGITIPYTSKVDGKDQTLRHEVNIVNYDNSFFFIDAQTGTVSEAYATLAEATQAAIDFVRTEYRRDPAIYYESASPSIGYTPDGGNVTFYKSPELSYKVVMKLESLGIKLYRQYFPDIWQYRKNVEELRLGEAADKASSEAFWREIEQFFKGYAQGDGRYPVGR